MKKTWDILLILLIPFGELKSFFYHSDLKVDWYLLSNNQRYLCYTIEDYSITLTFIIIFAYMKWAPRTKFGTEMIKFLFIVSVLDLIHLVTYDKQGMVLLKFGLAIVIFLLWQKKMNLKSLFKWR